MADGGSIGTPSFRQAVMQKQKSLERFKITGYEACQDNSGTSRERTQQWQKETRNNPKMSGKVNNGQENNDKRIDAGQRDIVPITIQTKGEEEHGAEKHPQEEEKKATASNPSSNKATQGACKPKKTKPSEWSSQI